MKEKIKLTVKQLAEIVFDESDDFTVIESKITGTFRHGNENKAVIKRLSDDKYFLIFYRDSIKESCEFEDLNYNGEYSEVFPVTKTITVYE